MDNSVTNIRAFDKNVMGCKRHKKDIMIAFQVENDSNIHDIFLTTEQAESLVAGLQKSLKINSEPE
jgi:hypothetical protein